MEIWKHTGIGHDSCGPSARNEAQILPSRTCLMMMTMVPKVLFSTGAGATEDYQTGTCCIYFNLFMKANYLLVTMSWSCLNAEAVKELYDKMLQSVAEKRTMPPNAWLWSLIENCTTQNDIKLLFDILQRLRVFVSYSMCIFFARFYFP